MDRAADVLELRFEPREERGLRVFVRALVQAVTLADTVSGNDTSGAGGAYSSRAGPTAPRSSGSR